MRDLAITVGVILAGVLVIGAAIIGFLMWRFKIPPRGVVAMGAALAYLVSPLDVLPEAALGPIGLVDDGGVIAAVTFYVVRLVTAHRMLREAGVPIPPLTRRPTRSDPLDGPDRAGGAGER